MDNKTLKAVHESVAAARKWLPGSYNHGEALKPAWRVFWDTRMNGNMLRMVDFWAWYNTLPGSTDPNKIYVWSGIGCRLLGKILREVEPGKVMMERIDGCEVGPVERSRLSEATVGQVNWAVYLGGPSIPPTGQPPYNCL